jgi:hypothetical protein
MKANECPYCKQKLVLQVDAIDTRFDDEEQDTSIDFTITSKGIVRNKKVPHYLEVCDKDRILVCNGCGKDSGFPFQHKALNEIRKQLKELNPTMI